MNCNEEEKFLRKRTNLNSFMRVIFAIREQNHVQKLFRSIPQMAQNTEEICHRRIGML